MLRAVSTSPLPDRVSNRLDVRDRPRDVILPYSADHAAVIDCLRIRDLGGDWLSHSSIEAGAHSDDVRDALVRDGLAVWDDLGIHITPRGRRVWADQRRALQDLAEMVRATPEGGYLLPPVPKAA